MDLLCAEEWDPWVCQGAPPGSCSVCCVFQPQVPFGAPAACGVASRYSSPGARLHFYSCRISEGSCWLIPMACQGVLDGSPALRFGVGCPQVSVKSVSITSLACASALSFAFCHNSCSSAFLLSNGKKMFPACCFTATKCSRSLF